MLTIVYRIALSMTTQQAYIDFVTMDSPASTVIDTVDRRAQICSRQMKFICLSAYEAKKFVAFLSVARHFEANLSLNFRLLHQTKETCFD